MRFVKSSPSEYLVVGRRGRIVSRGTAGSALLWPGATHVVIASSNQEARFEMTQETRDGIPLRFKGLVIYRVVDPVATAGVFEFEASGPKVPRASAHFSQGSGHEQIKTLLGQVCLGELRHTVSAMTMDECIEQRKTTLSQAVATALRAVVEGQVSAELDVDGALGRPARAWGIELELVQVAQVFVVDAELRAKLEAGRRNQLTSRSERSAIEMKEQIRLAQLASEAHVQQGALAAERDKAAVERERLGLKREVEVAGIEEEVPVRKLRLQRQLEGLRQELEVRRLHNQLRALEVEGELIGERERQELRRQILPLEQAPAMAAALSQILRGTHLSVYGEDSQLLAAVAPVLELLVEQVKKVS